MRHVVWDEEMGGGKTALLFQGDKDTVLTFAAGGGAGAACGIEEQQF